MKITKIEIHNLFNNSNPIILNLPNSQTTIIHGLNGMGKTTILNLIEAIFTGKKEILFNTIFKSIKINFDNNYYVSVEKIIITIPGKDIFTEEKKYTNLLFRDSDTTFTLYQSNFDEENNFSRRNNISSKSIRFSENYMDDDFEQRKADYRKSILDYHRFNKKIENLITVDMIETNRLYMYYNDTDPSSYYSTDNSENFTRQEESINIFSEQLKSYIEDVKLKKEYISEKLDSSYPIRLLTEEHKTNPTVISKNFKKFINRRSELQSLGLIDDTNDINTLLGSELKENLVPALDLYIQDSLKKLAAYDEIYPKLSVFLEIINDLIKNSNKRLIIKDNELKFRVKYDNVEEQDVPLQSLSSGEKHLIILFYYLIFNCDDKKTLILIDEPEISMHISWQEEFINYLNQICKTKNIQAIVTTHSPNIVFNHFDQLIGLTNEQ